MRQCYIVMPSLIGWPHAQYDPCMSSKTSIHQGYFLSSNLPLHIYTYPFLWMINTITKKKTCTMSHLFLIFIFKQFPLKMEKINIEIDDFHKGLLYVSRADSRLGPSQWEMSLQSNTISHWLGINLESALLYVSALLDDTFLTLSLHTFEQTGTFFLAKISKYTSPYF